MGSQLTIHPFLSPNEISEIKDYIDHNEFGLALEASIGIVIEENKTISNEFYDQIFSLACDMVLKEKFCIKQLKTQAKIN